jgi:hypothetical protein
LTTTRPRWQATTNDKSMWWMMRATTKRMRAARAMVAAMRWRVTKRARATRAMALATRAACNKESNGNSANSNDDKGGRQATATRAMAMAIAKIWGMAMATRRVGNKEGKGKGGKDNGDGNEGGK